MYVRPFDDVAKEADAEHRRLAALPRKYDLVGIPASMYWRI
jgi:hypothetical protein